MNVFSQVQLAPDATLNGLLGGKGPRHSSTSPADVKRRRSPSCSTEDGATYHLSSRRLLRCRWGRQMSRSQSLGKRPNLSYFDPVSTTFPSLWARHFNRIHFSCRCSRPEHHTGDEVSVEMDAGDDGSTSRMASFLPVCVSVSTGLRCSRGRRLGIWQRSAPLTLPRLPLNARWRPKASGGVKECWGNRDAPEW